MELHPLGDCGILIRLGERIDEEVHQQVAALSAHLDEHRFPGMLEQVPAFTSVAVYYDPVAVSRQPLEGGAPASPYARACARLTELLSGAPVTRPPHPRLIEIPACYGGSLGPDLAFVAEHNGLTGDEVVRIHLECEYRVHMIGFAPGFPYLGGMSDRIAAPRRASPRVAVPAGSVGIAGAQTGVYPVETPGGWQLIGRTPLTLFRPGDDPPTLLRMGDHVRFRAISRAEYDQWK